jgi:hypothetical protein
MAVPGGFKKIEAYTDDELKASIEHAKAECTKVGLDFWTLHRGIFAYIEQRNRKTASQTGEKLKTALKDSVDMGESLR